MTSRTREGHKAERGKPRVIPAVASEEIPSQSPLNFTLAVMRDDSKSDALRATMAKAALPYLHTRGQEKEQEQDDATESAPKSDPMSEPMSDLELARRIAHILALGEKQEKQEAAKSLLPSLRGEGEEKSLLCNESARDEAAHDEAPRNEPRANAEPFPVKPCAPGLTDAERAQRSDQPDPHPAYRWIA